MSRICRFWQTPLLVSVVVSLSCNPSNGAKTEKDDAGIAQSVNQADRTPAVDEADRIALVKEADLIIVGRIIGLIDTNPPALARKQMETHWLHVERTLKGIDETGQRLRARPNGMLWSDGKSYVLFLKRKAVGDFVEAVPGSLIEATPANIAAIDKVISGQGEGVRPKRSLWLQYTGGWGSGLVTEFFVTVDGDFEWVRRSQPGNDEKRTGRLPEAVIEGLIQQIVQAGPGPIIDDAGQVAFRWLDAKGKAQFKSYAAPDLPPAVDLLKTIQTLARQHGDQ